MKIGFFATGEGPHLDIAKHLVASAQKHMPEVPVVFLTDETTQFPGVEVIRLPGKMPMGVRRLTHYSKLEGEWLFTDTDLLFRKDVRPVFDKPFDVALATREGTVWHGSDYAKTYPYNTGVIFSRNRQFWRMALRGLFALPETMQEWGGEQYVTGALAQRKDFKVEILPSSYNFTPETRDEDVSHAHILHLKGPRKAWITTYL